MPGGIGHLAARFFETLRARPLTARESARVKEMLNAGLADAFFSQPHIDQRHGYEAARLVVESGADDDVILAALLHDVGKRHARMGVLTRSLTSLLIRLRIPLWPRARAYRDHGESGAVELKRLGAPPVAVEFARHHHGERPDQFDRRVWELLLRSDLPQRPGTGTAHG